MCVCVRVCVPPVSARALANVLVCVCVLRCSHSWTVLLLATLNVYNVILRLKPKYALRKFVFTTVSRAVSLCLDLCQTWFWLTEFSAVVTSCFTLSRSTTFTESLTQKTRKTHPFHCSPQPFILTWEAGGRERVRVQCWDLCCLFCTLLHFQTS